MAFVLKAQDSPEEAPAEEAFFAITSPEAIREVIETLPPEQKEGSSKALKVMVEVGQAEGKFAEIIHEIRATQDQIESLADPLGDFDEPTQRFFDALFSEMVPQAKSIGEDVKKKIDEGGTVVVNIVHGGKSILQVMRTTQMRKKVDWNALASALEKIEESLNKANDDGTVVIEHYQAAISALSEANKNMTKAVTHSYRIMLEEGARAKIDIKVLMNAIKQITGPTRAKSEVAVAEREETEVAVEELAQKVVDILQEAMERVLMALQITDSTMSELSSKLDALQTDVEEATDAVSKLQGITGGK